MEKPEIIDTVFWVGTIIMLLLAFGLVSITLFYKNHVNVIKRNEAEKLLWASHESEKKERIRIAADLHDGISGDLNSIRNYLTILKNRNQQIENQEIFEGVKASIDSVLENLREVSHNLMPPSLECEGLFTSVKKYFDVLSKRTSINFIIKGEEIFLGTSIEYEIYRIIQELTTNMIKHGNCQNCVVNIQSTTEQIKIELTDDGNLYDFQEQLRRSGGNGLKNIALRLKFISAHFTQQAFKGGNRYILTLKKKNA